MGKKKYLKDFYIIHQKHWYIIPTFVFYYNKNEFLETGVTTPAWSLSFKWLTFVFTIQMQVAY